MATDELARLRAENERLKDTIDTWSKEIIRMRDVLGQFADTKNWFLVTMHTEWVGPSRKPWQLAADALRGEGGEDGG